MVTRFVSVDFTSKGATRVTGALKDIEQQSIRTASVTSSSFRSSASNVEASNRKLATALKQSQGGLKGVASGLGSLGGGSLAAVAGITALAAGLNDVVNA